MTSKKSSLPPDLPDLPAGISVQKLQDGSLAFTIKTDLALITCRYDPRHVEARLKERVADLFEKARTGTSPNPGAGVPDFVLSSGSNVGKLVEVKGKNVRKFGDIHYSKWKLNKESKRYVERALELFLRSYHLELRESPSLFLIKMLAVTIGELEQKSGVLRTKKGVITMINEIYAELMKDFKSSWESPKRGRRRMWPKDKSPAAFLEVYNKALRDLNKIKDIYKTSKKSGDALIDEITQQYPDVDVPREIVENLKFDAPSEHSRKLAALRFGVDDGTYLDKVLEDARLAPNSDPENPPSDT